MSSKRDNTNIMIDDKADEVMQELFESLQNRYQNDFEKLVKGSLSLSSVMFIYCIINVIK